MACEPLSLSPTTPLPLFPVIIHFWLQNLLLGPSLGQFLLRPLHMPICVPIACFLLFFVTATHFQTVLNILFSWKPSLTLQSTLSLPRIFSHSPFHISFFKQLLSQSETISDIVFIICLPHWSLKLMTVGTVGTSESFASLVVPGCSRNIC